MRVALLMAAALLACTPAEASPPLSISAAIRADISSLIASRGWFVRFRPNDHGSRQALQALYETAGNAPIWVLDAQPTPQALALLRILRSADAFGLVPADYDAKQLAVAAGVTLPAGASQLPRRTREVAAVTPLPERWGMFDVNLSAAAMKFICDLHYRRIDPHAVGGLIKFDLPNGYDVYLHSTPPQQLFLKSRRAFSHGCIRVSDPVALAGYVLRDTPGGWTAERIEAAMNGTATRRVRLAHPIRVMILYGTVLAKEDGEVLFFSDLYGQDRRLEQPLGLEPAGAARRPT